MFRAHKSFKKEFKRQIKWAIIAAVGFIVAFAWRNAIYNSSQSIVEKFTDAADLILTEFYTAIFVTIVGVLLIMLSSKILRDRK